MQPFAAHAHDYYVIGLIEEGQRTLVCNDLEYTLEPGDLVVFNPGDVHACVQSDAGWLGYDSIAIDAALLDDITLQSPLIKDPLANTLFKRVISTIETEDDLRLEKELLALCDHLIIQQPNDETAGLHVEAAQHVFARFSGNLSNTPSIEELAANEHVSAYALIRAYRRRFAITPLQHLISLRIDCACKLLAEGVEPACVAAETGFSDQAHLTRAFKQRLGTTPAAYQRMLNTNTLTSDAR